MNTVQFMKKALFIAISTILVSTGISCQDQKFLPNKTVAEKATGSIITSVTDVTQPPLKKRIISGWKK
jgi:hypothetical protein